MSNKMELSLTSTTDNNSDPTSKPARTNLGKWKYDVFLSFRGRDTRNGFVSHLFDALSRDKIKTFLNKDLRKGKDISDSLLQNIKESFISIVIFSENYAHSPWCLDELVEIHECCCINKEKGQIVLPVFYKIDSGDVQELKGSYGDSVLSSHGDELKEKRCLALTEIAEKSGFDLRFFDDQTTLIENIVNCVLKILNEEFLKNRPENGLVGMESGIEEIKSLLELESKDVHFLGFWGIGGIGKTILACEIFNAFRSQFEGGCIITNVRERLKEEGINKIQCEMFSTAYGKENVENIGMPITWLSRWIKIWMKQKKVLIVLDDVSNQRDVEYLVGNASTYAPGSRIIMTGRNRQTLICVGAVIHEVKALQFREALQLLCLEAFKKTPLTEDFMKVVRKTVEYAQGLPVALKVLGSYLCDRTIGQWEDCLETLESYPNKEIQEVLKTSYDGLDYNEKEIFLDIACFFSSQDKDHVQSVLKSCGNSAGAADGINSLLDKSLIKISNNEIEMHNLLRQMGKEIVRAECARNPRKRSRLWIPQDIYNVLTQDLGREILVQSMSLDMSKTREIKLSSDAFQRMFNLRFLQFHGSYYPRNQSCYGKERDYHREEDFHDHKNGEVNVHLPKDGLTYLPYDLGYLYWYKFPSKSLPLNFCAENLVQLYLIHSHVEQLCDEDQCMGNLKILDLSYSMDLISIPDLSKMPNLEILCLRGCTSLVEIRSSLQSHEHLSHVDIINCKNLCRFPLSTNFTNLGSLSFKGCTSIKFPPLTVLAADCCWNPQKRCKVEEEEKGQ